MPDNPHEMSKAAVDKGKWVYHRPRRSQEAAYTLGDFALDVLRHLLLFSYAALGSLLALCCFYWLCASVFAHTFFGDAWMQPVIFLGATFFSGALVRMLSDSAHRSMGLFVAAIAGFGAFALLSGMDVQADGSLFSTRLLPEPLRFTLYPYLYLTPPAGLLGMLCFRWFTLR